MDSGENVGFLIARYLSHHIENEQSSWYDELCCHVAHQLYNLLHVHVETDLGLAFCILFLGWPPCNDSGKLAISHSSRPQACSKFARGAAKIRLHSGVFDMQLQRGQREERFEVSF